MLNRKNTIIEYIKNNWLKILAFIFLLLAIFIVYKGWFNTQIIARGDWKARSSAWISNWLNIPFSWDSAEYGGISNIFGGRIVRYPLYFIQAILNQVFNLRYAITERLIWFYPFLIISSLSIYFLTKEVFKSKIAGYAAIFIFLFNNFTIFRAHGAQMVLLMGQALTPLVILFFIRAVKRERFYLNILLAAIFLALLGYNDIRLAILCIGLILLYTIYIVINKLISKEYYSEISIKRVIGGFLVMTGVFVLLNSYWFIPTGFSGSQQELVEENFSNIDQVISLSRTGFMDTLSLSMGSDSQFGRYVYEPSQIFNYLAWILPILLIVPIFLKKNKREILFWFFAYLVLAFFAKGMMPPANFINQWFYDHVPLAQMYRLPDKFLYIMATPFAMLYGVSLAEILKICSNKNVYVKIPIVLFYITLPIVIIYPALFGENKIQNTIGGSSFKSEVSQKYFTIEEWLYEQPSNFKTLWVLGTPRYDIFSNSHPNFLPLDTVQKNSIYNKKYIEYLNSAKNINKYLALMNIGYLALTPEDDPDWAWHADDEQLENYLQSIRQNPGFNLQEVELGDDINIYKVTNPLEKISTVSNAMLISGSKRAFEYIFQDDSIDIHNWNFYVNENNKNIFNEVQDKIDTVMFYNNSEDDLLLTNIYQPYDQNISYDYNNYHAILNNLEESALGSRFENIKTNTMGNEINFDYKTFSDDNYQIWTRIAFENFNDPSMEVYVDDKYVDTLHPDPKYFQQYQWAKIGNIDLTGGEHKITLKTKSGNIAIDKFIMLPEKVYASARTDIDNWLKGKDIINVNCNDDMCNTDGEKINYTTERNIDIISWEEINPTEYLIKAKVANAGFINLVENFDPNWSAYYEDSESASILNNTISNSFYIDPKNKDQEISILLKYKPQGILELGYKVYMFAILCLCAGLIYALAKKK